MKLKPGRVGGRRDSASLSQRVVEAMDALERRSPGASESLISLMRALEVGSKKS